MVRELLLVVLRGRRDALGPDAIDGHEDPAAFLRALMELGDECSGTYCRATLPTRGADLTIGTDGFEILEPSKGSTKEGTFTCSAE